METTGYSLWLMPGGRAHDDLFRVITELSLKHRCPVFEPHITLTGHLKGDKNDIAARCARLAECLPDMEIELNGLANSEDYLYANITPSPFFSYAHSRAQEIFKIQSEPDYFPHLTLLYNLVPQTAREELVRRLNGRLSFSFRPDRLQLMGYGAAKDIRTYHPAGDFKLA